MVVVSLARKYGARVVVDVTNTVAYNDMAKITAMKSFLYRLLLLNHVKISIMMAVSRLCRQSTGIQCEHDQTFKSNKQNLKTWFRC
jgi:hypothetical protein